MSVSNIPSVISTLKNLLNNPVYSDLVLKCESQEFHVHRCIVCSQSPVLAAACGGDFKEANERVIDVSVVKASTLWQMITYLYTGDYNDSVANSLTDTPKSELQDDEEEAGTQFDLDLLGHPSNDANEKKTSGTNTNEIMMSNAYVYLVADYYQIHQLKDLAVTKFCTASKKFCLPGYIYLVSLVYGSEALYMAQQLKSVVSSNIAKNLKELLKDQSFLEECDRLPALTKEILPKLIAEHEKKSEEDGQQILLLDQRILSLIRESESLEIKLKIAEAQAKDAEAETVATRMQVNIAKYCRHCRKGSNVYFDNEIGKISLRCVCSTRY